MSDPYIGEIRLFAGNFAPLGWASCDGQLVSIAQNDALFNLIGTTYGGDGQSTFALPDFRGRVPIHVGTGFTQGQSGGSEMVNLTTDNLPAHTHAARCVTGVNTGNVATPGGHVWAAQSVVGVYANVDPTSQMAGNAMSFAGGSQPHDNMIPYLAVRFIIALEGNYPPQN